MRETRTIRLFLSSTFHDFVFPALRARLKDRFVELVDVDLRWALPQDFVASGFGACR